ncbi:hypothetical protein FOE78_14145 [Microlunatus elymi]|uniref:HTH luxR-type domain-containing protein n=2 Tax=Microlunatus elymi TaxID=2596828 RepID=A0A516Q5V5_9ACTN|nr:hypothetical protein FOE78_14145 [Microlunatus elymi]
MLAELDRPVSIVLDGYDLADAVLTDGLIFLLGHSGGKFRPMLVCRTDPKLPLARLRLSGTIAEVGMADLAFTAGETGELLERGGIEVGPPAVARLTEHARGWAAGIRFASLELERGADPEVQIPRLAGDTGDISQFLMAEMLRTQTPQEREVLLRTSVVDVLEPGLIEALGGRLAARTLARLARANVLLEAVSPPGWYRYHPFFREFLVAELANGSPSRLTRLRRRAAEWYRAKGQIPDVPGPSRGPLTPVTAATATSDRTGYDPGARDRVDGKRLSGDRSGAARTRVRTAGATPALRVVVNRAAIGQPDSLATEPSVIEPLTPRETEVLGYLAELLTTDEIAAAMFVSVNTIRTHIRNILRKLAVSRRNEAVRRARALSLLQSDAR